MHREAKSKSASSQDDASNSPKSLIMLGDVGSLRSDSGSGSNNQSPYAQAAGTASDQQGFQPHAQPVASTSSGSGLAVGSVPNITPTSSEGRRPNQIADKSCARCRERKVRCDRVWPTCKRCRKRREECSYPEIVNLETAHDVSDDERIGRLETKLSALEAEFRRTSPPARAPSTGPGSDPPSAQNFSPTPENVVRDLSAAIYDAVTSDTTGDEAGALTSFLFEQFMQKKSNVGHHTVDWRLAGSAMGSELTTHLVEASFAAACSRLPAFCLLQKRIQPFPTRLPSLVDPSSQIDVCILAALGARSSPHSALLGVPLPDSPSPDLLLHAGERRERACRALVDLAWDLCWRLGIMWDPALGGERELEALVGLTQLQIFEDVRSTKGRWLLRNSVGMYQDIIHQGAPISSEIRESVGPILFASDSTISAQLYKPCLISRDQVETYFAPNSTVYELENAHSSLADLLDRMVRTRMTEQDLRDALEEAITWVCACQRTFAILCTSRRPGETPVFPAIKQLWLSIDEVHSAVQRMQQILINLKYTPEGIDDAWAMDDYILLGVRTDTGLVDVCNLIHRYLQDNGQDDGANGEVVRQMLMESELRVRKCLKLLAFYSQLYLSSRDKHMSYHLTQQLDLLPNWTELVCQKVGQVGGPTSAEFELSESELDWYQRALELACFYTPQAFTRLTELLAGRQQSINLSTLPSTSVPFESRTAQSFDALPPSYGAPFAPNLPVAMPEELSFTFDSLGIPMPYSGSPLVHAPEFANAFTGKSWMDPALTEPWDGRSDTGDAGGGDIAMASAPPSTSGENRWA